MVDTGILATDEDLVGKLADCAQSRGIGGLLGSGSTADVANCITWVSDKGASVISMSLGGGDSTTLHNAVQYAWKNGNGALIVAAAGNDADSTLEYPAAYAEVDGLEADRRACAGRPRSRTLRACASWSPPGRCGCCSGWG